MIIVTTDNHSKFNMFGLKKIVSDVSKLTASDESYYAHFKAGHTKWTFTRIISTQRNLSLALECIKNSMRL